MTTVPVLMERIPKGPARVHYSGRWLKDVPWPNPLRLSGRREDNLLFEMTKELVEQARRTEMPVALVEIETLQALEVRPGSEFRSEIGYMKPGPAQMGDFC